MMDIETTQDCRTLVDAFYRTARQHPLLGPVLESRIDGHWEEHLERMTLFWETVLFARPRYSGKPLERHLGLPIGMEHFETWVGLWTAEVDRRFSGARADLAKHAATRMALRLSASLEAHASHGCACAAGHHTRPYV